MGLGLLQRLFLGRHGLTEILSLKEIVDLFFTVACLFPSAFAYVGVFAALLLTFYCLKLLLAAFLLRCLT